MIHYKSVFRNDLQASRKIIHCTIIAFLTILLLWEELAMQPQLWLVIIAYTVLVEFTAPFYV